MPALKRNLPLSLAWHLLINENDGQLPVNHGSMFVSTMVSPHLFEFVYRVSGTILQPKKTLSGKCITTPRFYSIAFFDSFTIFDLLVNLCVKTPLK